MSHGCVPAAASRLAAVRVARRQLLPDLAVKATGDYHRTWPPFAAGPGPSRFRATDGLKSAGRTARRPLASG